MTKPLKQHAADNDTIRHRRDGRAAPPCTACIAQPLQEFARTQPTVLITVALFQRPRVLQKSILRAETKSVIKNVENHYLHELKDQFALKISQLERSDCRVSLNAKN